MKKIKDIKIAIVGSNYHGEITENLEKNCLKTLKEKGLKESQITKLRVPGALEIPLAVQKLAKKGIFDAIIVFGAIHKGKTYHFELIANECSRACMDISLKYETPIIFEVLAAFDINDALDRATREKGNKGVEGALTALEMIKVLSDI